MARIAGFTLLEILVGVVLVVVIGFLFAELIRTTGVATRLSTKGIDAAGQARLAFDRMGMDFKGLVKRADTGFSAATNAGSYPLTFLSEVRSQGVSSTNNRGVSLVAYQVSTNADATLPCLLRAGKAMAWNAGGPDLSVKQVLGIQTNGLPVIFPANVIAASDFDVLSPGVIRMVVGYQLYPDGDTTILADGSVVDSAGGQLVYSPPVLSDEEGHPTVQVDLGRVSTIIVGVIATDSDSLKSLTAAQVQLLAGRFPTPTAGQLPVAAWSRIAENVEALPADVPLPARRSLRAFQRAFPINSFGLVSP